MSDKVTIDHKVIAEDRILQIKNKQEQDKHLKGYIYDSLIYRYQIALDKAYLKDIEDYMIQNSASRKEAEPIVMRRHDRDLIRFRQILNEAIGEHD